jgi:CBS domain-containing membrane protein
MHPPGGATALIYVMGNDLNTLGWLYPITPIGIGAFLMLIVALIVNNLSSNTKRHYPIYWI